MKVTLIHPCVGRRAGRPYLRGWQMAPLAPAVLASLTPPDVKVAFYDDSLEPIPFDDPTDLIGINVEAYTARRAYQIASEYRRRGVPVVMGGVHATLCPDEVSRYAESVVVGEAEQLWPRILADAERHALQPLYRSPSRPPLIQVRPNRSIYGKRNYLPLGMVETGRGCRHQCEFCSVQSAYGHTRVRRPVEDVLADVEQLRDRPLIFFVDDNITADLVEAKELFRALIPLGVKWVSQASINTAYDEECLQLMTASGCMGVLMGFESLDPATLKEMNKGFNMARGGFEQALANLRRHRLSIYATFVFGYDHDTTASFEQTLAFALEQKFYMAAFNHLVPFPGTPLYHRLEAESRLIYDAWWLDSSYRFNMAPFRPLHMTPEEVERNCYEARRRFYALRSIWQRGLDPVTRSNFRLWLGFYAINALSRREVGQRHHFPLGDETWRGEIIQVRRQGIAPPPAESRAAPLPAIAESAA
jgi:radical SAM superfamily enzyme YgiQ (UPF0313 family)